MIADPLAGIARRNARQHSRVWQHSNQNASFEMLPATETLALHTTMFGEGFFLEPNRPVRLFSCVQEQDPLWPLIGTFVH
jgi:hypothetical protein